MSFWIVQITLQHHSKVGSSAMKMCNADLVPLNTCRSVEWQLLEQEIITGSCPSLSSCMCGGRLLACTVGIERCLLVCIIGIFCCVPWESVTRICRVECFCKTDIDPTVRIYWEKFVRGPVTVLYSYMFFVGTVAGLHMWESV